MAFPARVTTWVAGDTLTASALNAEFNNLINANSDGTKDVNVAAVNVASLGVSGTSQFDGNVSALGAITIIGDASTDTLNVNSSANFNNAVSLLNTVTINGAVVVNALAKFNNTIIGGMPTPGFVDNLGLTLANGVLTVTQANSTAISSGSNGFVCVPSTTAGQFVVLAVNAAATIQDDSNATSHFTNFECGVTSTSNWSQDVPWFVYVVNKGNNAVASSDGNSCFALSRNPAMSTSPSSANNIGDKTAIPATDDQTSIILMASSITKANYTSLPMQLVGAVRMQYLTATNDWTFQTLGNKDGFGQVQVDKILTTEWVMPTAQMGANTASYLLANSGTEPVFTTNAYTYVMFRNGEVRHNIYLAGDGGADGSGSVSTRIASPFTWTAPISNMQLWPTMGWYRAAATDDRPLWVTMLTGTSYFSLNKPTTSGGAIQNVQAAVQHTEFSPGDRRLAFVAVVKYF